MFTKRLLIFAFAAALQLSPSSSAFATVTGPAAPVALGPGASVTDLPNGGSSYAGDEGTVLFDNINDLTYFSFDDGAFAGDLRERVIRYSQTNIYHPYGGLYFDYEITLTSGNITEFSAPGYSGFEVAVKDCGVSSCGGSGANGIAPTEASRSADGNWVSFLFGNELTGGHHSANLQLLTNATSFIDPDATFTDANGDVFSVPILAPAAPEPSTWAMLIVGFGALAMAARRRATRRLAAV